MKEVLVYGISKEPVYGVIGDRVDIQEYTTYSNAGITKRVPLKDGNYFCCGVDDDLGALKISSLPIHTMVLNRVDHHGRHHREERHITFTPEFIQEIGGNPVEMLEEIQQLQGHSKKLSKELLDVNDTLTLLKTEISTASLWKRLKWVFTGVEV